MLMIDLNYFYLKKQNISKNHPQKRDDHKFYFLKSLITLVCIRITTEDDKKL